MCGGQAARGYAQPDPTTMTVPENSDRGLDPLYRRTFVGRSAERNQLATAFDAAMAGTGRLAMVVGEPGIGKTALCEQLAAYVRQQGGQALIGYCYEAGMRTLPYLPFVEALRGYVVERDISALARELGGGAGDVARLIPELGDRLQLEPPPAGDPEHDRRRLLQSWVAFLTSAAADRPLLLVLEDLQDADRGTLDLLLHLARNLRAARILVVGTYRDVEVDRAHPLSDALAELQRAGTFVRMPLHGLSVDEVHRMFCEIRGQEVPRARAVAVHRQTEGNPLFVQEVLRYIVEAGLVVRLDGRYVRADDGAPESGIPEGLRDVVGKRLSRLSPRANQLLAIAAVIGREFRLDVLQKVAQVSEEEVIVALEEAQQRAVIEERGASIGSLVLRFTHALFRQTLYEELFIARRMRWHQQVARTLESTYARRLSEHAAELAEHFAHSTDAADLAKAVAYGEMAADQAMRVYASGQAERLLRQALLAQDVLDPDEISKRCDLLLKLGEALLPQEQPGRVVETASQAFELAESNHDPLRAARAAVQALEALERVPRGVSFAEVGEWVARADRHATVGTPERVYADLYLGMYAFERVGPAHGHAHLRTALERARELGDDRVLTDAMGLAMAFLRAPRDLELVEQLERELSSRPHTGLRTYPLAARLLSVARIHLGRGDREAAEQAWRELLDITEQRRDMRMEVWALTAPISIAVLDGRLEEAIDLVETQRRLAQETGILGVQFGLGFPLTKVPNARVHQMLGRDVEPLLPDFEGPAARTVAARVLVLAYLGRCDESMALLFSAGDISSHDDETWLMSLADLLEASVICRNTAVAAVLVARLARFAGGLHGYLVSFGRLLGEAAVTLGQFDAAREYYRQAIEVCQKTRFRPELALTRLDMSELLVTHFPAERAEALQQLGLATTELSAMRMQPGLERALRLSRWYGGAGIEDRVLTAREQEVAALVARGMSNREIAQALVITEGTAEVHVKHILSKLGLRSRYQIAVAWAARGQPSP
jgi:DNA-binding CsgD family transcriptional regulator